MTQPATTIDEMLTSSEFAHDPYPERRSLLRNARPLFARGMGSARRIKAVGIVERDHSHRSTGSRSLSDLVRPSLQRTRYRATSDYPLDMGVEEPLRQISAANLYETDRELIRGQNDYRLLGIDHD